MDEEDDQYIDFDNFYLSTGHDNEDDDDATDDSLLMSIMKMEQIHERETMTTTLEPQEQDEEEEEEEQLSQKLSQLSASDTEQMKEKSPITTTTTTTTTTSTKKRASSTSTSAMAASSGTKKLKTTEDTLSSERIPNYLSHSDGRFDEMLHSSLKHQWKSVDIEDLRQFAIIIHHLKCLELHKSLWNKYLQSGTGELIKQERIRSVLGTTSEKLPLIRCWPMEVKFRMIKYGQTKVTDPNDIDDASCLNYVKLVLVKYDQQTQFYRHQYASIIGRLKNVMTDTIEDAITTFVRQHGITLYRICIDKSITNIEFNYKDQLIQFTFHQTRPISYQQQVFENLFQLKRATEQAKLHVALLKQRLVHKQLPKSFDLFRIPTSIDFDSIDDRHMRERLKHRCENILQYSTSHMMLVHIALAETKFSECQNKFEKEMKEMKKNQQCGGTFNERSTRSLVDLMNVRFKNLDEHLMRLYKMKLNFFDRAPTGVN